MTAKKTAKKSAAASVKEQFFDVISSPLVTEKSARGTEYNKVVFRVRNDANKTVIKQAVEAMFGVQVVKVNTLNVEGKKKIFRGRPGRRADFKKAVVTLAAGQSIDFAAGVK